MRKAEVHFGFQFKDGLNTDPVPFQTANECSPGGFYFFEECEAQRWLDVYDDIQWVRQVDVPDGVPLHHESNGKWKAAQIFLHPRRPLDEWLAERPSVAADAVRRNPNVLGDLPARLRTPELCLAAIARNSSTLRFVPVDVKTYELCRAAVRVNGTALQWVPGHMLDRELCLEAVTMRDGGTALRWVPKRLMTPELCHAAVKSGPAGLAWVPDDMLTAELCLAAVRRHGRALQFVPLVYMTQEMCLAAVKQDPCAVEFVPAEVRSTTCMPVNTRWIHEARPVSRSAAEAGLGPGPSCSRL